MTITKKMSLFPKTVVDFGFFTNAIECERGKKDFNNKVKLSFLMPGKRVSKNIIQLVYFNYYKGKSTKEIVVSSP